MAARPQDPDGQERSKAERTERKAFLLRLPPELLAELKGWAAHELRSLNGHIEYLLRDAVRRRKGGSGDG